MTGLIDRLKIGETLVSDGAMSTMLQTRGQTAVGCPEEWNVTHPDDVAFVYSSYVTAGSDLISTNTFGGNTLKLARYGVDSRVAELNAAGVTLAKHVADSKNVLVVASIGPTGHLLEPLGELSVEGARDAFRPQLEAVVAAGADAALFETFFDLGEVKAGLSVALRLGLTVICTMTFDATGRTVMGLDAASAAKSLVDAGAQVVGANCGLGPESMLPIVEAMAGNGVYVMVQPNAGLPTVHDGTTTYNVSPVLMASFAKRFVDAGANIVGGCCGSTPEHIAAIAKAVKG